MNLERKSKTGKAFALHVCNLDLILRNHMITTASSVAVLEYRFRSIVRCGSKLKTYEKHYNLINIWSLNTNILYIYQDSHTQELNQFCAEKIYE